MRISGWGKYPVVDAELGSAASEAEVRSAVEKEDGALIARGLGRSYGDSSLSQRVLSMLRLDRMLAFDEEQGRLKCEAGVTLSDILDVFAPRGWFLPVVPGTRFVTVGGAISADVHGKNHHRDGSFCDFVESMEVMLASGETRTCSPDENTELFRAVCGGMGLMGIVLRAVLRLRRIETVYIKQKNIAAPNLDTMLDLFHEHEAATYSVAWIDCVARGGSMGRSVLMLGEHARTEDLPAFARPFKVRKKTPLSVPVDFPGFVLNPLTVKAFNELYYWRQSSKKGESVAPYGPFFHPLDNVLNWNRIYGKNGFAQYQFVLPVEAGKEGMAEVLRRISAQGTGSFLAVLKLFGDENANLLSFPRKGYTLALDFPVRPGLFEFLDELDRIVLDHGGRLYLAKDVRMSSGTFRIGYPRAGEFVELKHRLDGNGLFRSLQAERLEIL